MIGEPSENPLFGSSTNVVIPDVLRIISSSLFKLVAVWRHQPHRELRQVLEGLKLDFAKASIIIYGHRGQAYKGYALLEIDTIEAHSTVQACLRKKLVLSVSPMGHRVGPSTGFDTAGDTVHNSAQF